MNSMIFEYENLSVDSYQQIKYLGENPYNHK